MLNTVSNGFGTNTRTDLAHQDNSNDTNNLGVSFKVRFLELRIRKNRNKLLRTISPEFGIGSFSDKYFVFLQETALSWTDFKGTYLVIHHHPNPLC